MRINDQLKPLAVPITDLVPDPANARLHDEFNVESIRTSLEEFGQQKPVVVNDRGVVIAGNGTLRAAIELGATEIAVVRYDGEGDEDAFGVADNRTAELARWDWRTLAGKLRTLKGDGFDVKRLGWRDYELDPILNATWKPPRISDEDLKPDHAKPVTIKLTSEQHEVVARAMGAVRDRVDQPDMSDGRALELLAADYLAGPVSALAADRRASSASGDDDQRGVESGGDDNLAAAPDATTASPANGQAATTGKSSSRKAATTASSSSRKARTTSKPKARGGGKRKAKA